MQKVDDCWSLDGVRRPKKEITLLSCTGQEFKLQGYWELKEQKLITNPWEEKIHWSGLGRPKFFTICQCPMHLRSQQNATVGLGSSSAPEAGNVPPGSHSNLLQEAAARGAGPVSQGCYTVRSSTSWVRKLLHPNILASGLPWRAGDLVSPLSFTPTAPIPHPCIFS